MSKVWPEAENGFVPCFKCGVALWTRRALDSGYPEKYGRWQILCNTCKVFTYFNMPEEMKRFADMVQETVDATLGWRNDGNGS